jgi:hypothetical protein
VFPNLLPQIIFLSYAGGIFGNINLNPDMFTRNEEVKEGEKVVEEVLPRLFMQELQELATALEVDTSAMLYEDDTR